MTTNTERLEGLGVAPWPESLQPGDGINRAEALLHAVSIWHATTPELNKNNNGVWCRYSISHLKGAFTAVDLDGEWVVSPPCPTEEEALNWVKQTLKEESEDEFTGWNEEVIWVKITPAHLAWELG